MGLLCSTVEPLNSGHFRDKCFVHCSEVVPSSEVEMYGQYTMQGVKTLSTEIEQLTFNA